MEPLVARRDIGSPPDRCDIISTVTATYLYCVVKAAKKPPVNEAPDGLPGASRPEVIEVTRPVWMVVADVPADLYSGAALDRALADLDRVGEIAVGHEAVVEYFARQRTLTVIPLKLFTMFSSREKAAADIRQRRTSIERTMKRIAGAEEWGVRVFRSDRRVASDVSEPSPTSGAAFLTAKKRVRDEARAARVAAAEAADHVFDELSEVARDAHRRLDAPATAATPPLLDAAFLVPVEKRATFQRAAEREADACQRAGAELTLTGPWPAYHFAYAD
jgi:hypothetical protein